jgi:hypothetical protein
MLAPLCLRESDIYLLRLAPSSAMIDEGRFGRLCYLSRKRNRELNDKLIWK